MKCPFCRSEEVEWHKYNEQGYCYECDTDFDNNHIALALEIRKLKRESEVQNGRAK